MTLARCLARSHEADRTADGPESGAGDQASRTGALAEQSAWAGGAPGGAAARWQGFARLQIIARTRLGTGLANPSEWGLAKPIQARLRRCSEEMPGTMRGLANPWRLPTLH